MSSGMPSSAKTDNPALAMSELWAVVWENRGLILVVVLVVMGCTYGVSFLMAPQFTARVSMLPQGQGAQSDILGRLTSLTGAPLSSSGSTEGFYLEILRSDRILDQLIEKKWNFQGSSEPVSLYQVFGVQEPVSRPGLSSAQEQLLKKKLRQEAIFFYRDRVNGFMVVKVTVPDDPQLAADLANYLVELLDDFNKHFHRTKAQDQREFVQNRLAVVEDGLQQAELELAEFKQHNRGFASSPLLLRKAGELEREVQARTATWVELRRQLEMARIDENKQLVSVDILDSATPPVRRSSPNRILMALFGGSVAFLALYGFLLVKKHESR